MRELAKGKFFGGPSSFRELLTEIGQGLQSYNLKGSFSRRQAEPVSTIGFANNTGRRSLNYAAKLESRSKGGGRQIAPTVKC